MIFILGFMVIGQTQEIFLRVELEVQNFTQLKLEFRKFHIKCVWSGHKKYRIIEDGPRKLLESNFVKTLLQVRSMIIVFSLFDD